ncbi:MAG: aminoglycoside phosphotransferase family protein, partial [Acidimicrobiales bacterium]
MSSAVHLVTVERADGGRAHVALRRYVRPELNAEEPGIADREAAALRFVEAVELPTPRLLALDSAGAEADVPTIVMSRLPGHLDWSPVDLDSWLHH